MTQHKPVTSLTSSRDNQINPSPIVSRPSVIMHTSQCNVPPPPSRGVFGLRSLEMKKWRDLQVPNDEGEVVHFIGNSVADIYFPNCKGFKNVEEFLTDLHIRLYRNLITYMTQWDGIKVNFWLECKFTKDPSNEKTSDILNANFKTKTSRIMEMNDIEPLLSESFAKLGKEIDEFQEKGSGWSLLCIDGLLLNITRYTPLQGSAYIPLPTTIANTGSVINVQNSDQFCFKYAVLGSLLSGTTQYLHRQSIYRNLISDIDFSTVSFPTKLNEIGRFERRNKLNINVYGINKEDKIYPLIVSNNNSAKHIDLLYVTDRSGNSHYCLIKDLNRLVHHQFTNSMTRSAICRKCFKSYRNSYITRSGKTSEERLKEHRILCDKFKPIVYEFPTEDYVQFNKFQHMTRVPIVIYSDMECMLRPLGMNIDEIDAGEELRRSDRLNVMLNKHQPICIGMYVKSYDHGCFADQLHVFKGPNCLEDYLRKLKEICFEVETLYARKTPMSPMTFDDMKRHNEETACQLCSTPFSESVKKNCDHDHITGKYRFTLCDSCNLKLVSPKFIPVYFHNLSGYDGHFLIQKLGMDAGKIDVIPQTSEKFVSFSKTFEDCKLSIRFLDSYRFLSAGLAELVNNLSEFPEMSKVFPDNSIRPMLLRKGVYPYKYISNWDVLSQTSLPPIEDFYNDLAEENISQEDYIHAQLVWKTFKCKTIMDYTTLYMTTDIILLSDVFEQYRKISLTDYKLDPCWSYTSPGFFWSAMLKMTGVKLQILKDIDMILFVESGIRGGMTQSVKRYVEANNPDIPESYDATKPTSYILYTDVNNLYGWSMLQNLPKDGFTWMEDVENFDVLSIDAENSNYGYILEVDIEYPNYLHELHSDFPFLPESRIPPLSKGVPSSVKKLILTLDTKERYITHYVNLQQAMKAGLKLVKIHRILQFNQSKWLSTYINFNTNYRAQATTEFQKSYYKLANNCVFGRSMMNVRNRIDIRLVTSERHLRTLANSHNFINRDVYSDNLIAVRMDRDKIKFDQPIYVGFTILELSKTLMYDIHYNHFKSRFKDNVNLCYMDTDSLVYEIICTNLVDNLFEMSNLFDFSNYPNYPKRHKCYSVDNKKVVGKLKDETASIPIVKFIALRPKMYSYVVGNDNITKVKGVKKSYIKHHVQFNDLFHTLCTTSDSFATFKNIASKRHNVYTVGYKKKALTFFDDKRIILSDSIHTLPYGHKDLLQLYNDLNLHQ